MPSEATSVLRVAVLASGQGTTFEVLVCAGRRGEMVADVVLLIASRQDAPVVELARRLGVECVVLDEKLYGSSDGDAAMEGLLTRRQVDLVVLAGFLRKVGPGTLITFAGRVINTHPAPLPRLGARECLGSMCTRRCSKLESRALLPRCTWSTRSTTTGRLLLSEKSLYCPMTTSSPSANVSKESRGDCSSR